MSDTSTTDGERSDGHAARSFAQAGIVHRSMRRFAATRMGATLFRPTSHHLDKLVAALTHGKKTFVGAAAGLPVVMLTTTGAKSGQPRTVPVIGIPHDDGLALVASNFGEGRHPGWYHNLKAHPHATVNVGGRVWDADARLATPDEREQIWARGVALYPAFDAYETRAARRHLEAFVLRGTDPR